jgi:hypothetical protein
MLKMLACRVGRHAWTSRVEEGQTFMVCGVCGKEKDQSGRGIQMPGAFGRAIDSWSKSEGR